MERPWLGGSCPRGVDSVEDALRGLCRQALGLQTVCSVSGFISALHSSHFEVIWLVCWREYLSSEFSLGLWRKINNRGGSSGTRSVLAAETVGFIRSSSFCFTKSWLQCCRGGAGQMTRVLRCLPCNHKGLSFAPSNQVKYTEMVVPKCNSSAGGWRPMDPWGLLVSKPNSVCKPPGGSKWPYLDNKKVNGPRGTTPEVDHCPLCAPTYITTHMEGSWGGPW